MVRGDQVSTVENLWPSSRSLEMKRGLNKSDACWRSSAHRFRHERVDLVDLHSPLLHAMTLKRGFRTRLGHRGSTRNGKVTGKSSNSAGYDERQKGGPGN